MCVVRMVAAQTASIPPILTAQAAVGGGMLAVDQTDAVRRR